MTGYQGATIETFEDYITDEKRGWIW
jgi:hypothetical protein